MSRSDTKVIVVGAGPAGVGLAYLLASRGVSVTLLERYRDFSREFRDAVLLPSGFEALEQMGLGDVVTTIPHIAPTAFELYANARWARTPTYVLRPPVARLGSTDSASNGSGACGSSHPGSWTWIASIVHQHLQVFHHDCRPVGHHFCCTAHDD